MAMIQRRRNEPNPPSSPRAPLRVAFAGTTTLNVPPLAHPLDQTGRPEVPPGRLESLETVLDDFADRWERGERPQVEDHLHRLEPGTPDEAVALIYQAYCLAESTGASPAPGAYLERFPEHRDRLIRLFRLHEALTPDALGLAPPPAPALPVAGDSLGPYAFLRELGRGTFARVFLAEQVDLEHRLVVVKVTARTTNEPKLLARCRHPHIVEVLRDGQTGDGAFQFVCMPFLGGATLAEVLAERRASGLRLSGKSLLSILDRIGAPEFVGSREGRPTRELLAALSERHAMAWLTARLADALDHAWRRGVTHGDLKPSNVLLAADGQPMLLDFNLALDWNGPDDLPNPGQGGTLAYMAPERLRALLQAGTARPSAAERHRADIYALGLILAEALGGAPPWSDAPHDRPIRELAAHLAERRAAPDFTPRQLRAVPAPLRPILARCLAPDPADRYRTAADLAADLDRFRLDQPPCHARPNGPRTALGQALHRHRRAVALAVAVLCAGALGGVAACLAHHRSLEALASAKLDVLWNGSEPDSFLPPRTGLTFNDAPERLAESAQRQLTRYRVFDDPGWRQRDDVRFLNPRQRDDLELWLMEQAWRFAAAALGAGSSTPELHRALTCLENAGGEGPPRPLDALADQLRARLGRPNRSRARSEPSRAADAYLEGVEAESRGDGEAALGHFQRALLAQPGAFWPTYHAATAARKLRAYDLAADYFQACVALRPANPLLRVLLAGTHYERCDYGTALVEIQRALELDPESPEAMRTLVFIRWRLDQSELLGSDLNNYQNAARNRGHEPRHALLFDACSVMGDSIWEQASPPLRDLAFARAAAEDDIEARVFLACCLRDLKRGDEAIELLRSVVETAPDHVWAAYTLAMALGEQNHPDSIDSLYSLLEHARIERLFESKPETIQAHRFLASKLLKAHRHQEARDVLQSGLRRIETIGRRRLRLSQPDYDRLRAEFHFSLARLFAFAEDKLPDSVELRRHALHEARRLAPAQFEGWLAKTADELKDRAPRPANAHTN